MEMSRIIGLIGLVLGAALLFFAWQGANAPVDQLAEAVSGRYTNATMWLLIGGLVALVAGGSMLLFGRPRA